VQEAAQLMCEQQVRRLVVLNRDKRLVGIVSLGDLAVETGDEKLVGKTLERQQILSLVHDIFGNPFRPVALDPSWLAWNDGAIPKLAQAIYDERAFDRLPILADALEEAGCSNQDILGHCREPGPHIRGCWIVDLLLGKK